MIERDFSGLCISSPKKIREFAKKYGEFFNLKMVELYYMRVEGCAKKVYVVYKR